MEVLQQPNKKPDHGDHASVVTRPQSDTMHERGRYRRQARGSKKGYMTRRHDDRSIDPVTMAAASALVRARQHARMSVAAPGCISAGHTAKEQWQRKFGNPQAASPSSKPNVHGIDKDTLETKSDVPWAPSITSMYRVSEPQVSSPLNAPVAMSSPVNVKTRPRPRGNSMSSLSRSSARSIDPQMEQESSSVTVVESGSTSCGSLISSSNATGAEVDCSASSSGIHEASDHGGPNGSFTDESSPTNSVQSGLSCPSIVASTSSSSSPSSVVVVVVVKDESTESKRSFGDSSGIETHTSSGTTASAEKKERDSSSSLIDGTIVEPSLEIFGTVVPSDDSRTIKTEDIDSIARDTIQAYIDLHVIADSVDMAASGDIVPVAAHHTVDIAPSETFDTKDIDPDDMRRVGDYIDSIPRTSSDATLPTTDGIENKEVAPKRGRKERPKSSGLDLRKATSISSGGNLRGPDSESIGPFCPVEESLCIRKVDDVADPIGERNATPVRTDAPDSQERSPKSAARPVSAERGVDPPYASLYVECSTLKSDPPVSSESTVVVSDWLNDSDSLFWREALATRSNAALASNHEQCRAGCDPPSGIRDNPRQVPKERVPLESLSFETALSNASDIAGVGSLIASIDFVEQVNIQCKSSSGTLLPACNKNSMEVNDTSENVTRDFLPSRQSMGEPDVYATANNTIECVSADGRCLDMDRAVARIYGILVGSSEQSETVFVSFVLLLRLYFPLLMKGPTSPEVSMMLNHAKELNVSLAAMDRLVDSSQAMHCESHGLGGNESGFTTEDEKMQWFVRCLLRHFDSSSAHSIHRDLKTANDYSNAACHSNDSFEVEVNNGYARQEYAPKPDDEPWWKVAARLDNPFDHGNPDRLNEIDKRGSPSIELPLSMKYGISPSVSASLEDDIANHWKQRQVCRQQEALTTKSKGGNTRDIVLPETALHTKRGLETKGGKKRLERFQRRRDVLKYWQSRQNLVAISPLLKTINAVDAVSGLSRRKRFASQSVVSTPVWMLSYTQRTGSHSGFIGVDTHSLVSTSSVVALPRSQDESPWESRDVKQRFLHEQSVTGRNWFGCLTFTRGNRKIKEPVCRPRSMEMPMEAGEWTEEWYKQSQRIPLSSGTSENPDELSDDESWEKTPECGTIRNVRLKIGERISRVTPDLTSSLRRSRWRKKHFSPGMFPYV